MVASAITALLMEVGRLNGIDGLRIAGDLAAFFVIVAGILVALAVLLAVVNRLWFAGGSRTLSYEIDGDKIGLTDANGMGVSVPWTSVRRLRERGGVLWLSLRPAGQRYIPTRAFSTADLDALRALAREKLGAEARL